jgi:hypothetical protein
VAGAAARRDPHLRVTWTQVLAWRVRRHQLDRPGAGGPVAVAHRLAGVHAQLKASAELAIAIRDTAATPAATRDAVERQRSLVKTWAMRGTLHLLPAAELPLWVAGLRTRAGHLRGSWLRYHGVTADDLQAVLDAVPKALDGRCLTRDELAGEVASIAGRPGLVEVLRQGWGAVLKPAAYRGDLCFGPSDGRNVAFVLPRQWIGAWPEVDPAEALPEILRRFLDAYGPATRDEFSRWFGLDPGPTRQVFESLAGDLVEVDVEGRRAWMTGQGAAQLAGEPGEPGTGPVRLLPAFDPYVVGALRHVEHLLPGPFRDEVSRKAGWISPVLLVGGRIAGTWGDDRRGGRLAVDVQPFTPLDAGTRVAAEAHAHQLATLLDAAEVQVTWAPARTGATSG